MNKARIEELARSCYGADNMTECIEDALLTLAEECYEGAARKCEETEPRPFPETEEFSYDMATLDCAAAIRAMNDGLK